MAKVATAFKFIGYFAFVFALVGRSMETVAEDCKPNIWTDIAAVVDEHNKNGTQADLTPKSLDIPLRFQDPRQPIERLIFTKMGFSAVGATMLPKIIEKMKTIAPGIPIQTFEFKADDRADDYRPFHVDIYSQRPENLAFMELDILGNGNWTIETTQNDHIQKSHPISLKLSGGGLWTRDAFHIFRKSTDGGNHFDSFHIVQIPHRDFGFVPLSPVFQEILGKNTSTHYFSGFDSEFYRPNETLNLRSFPEGKKLGPLPVRRPLGQDMGGNIVPLSDRIAFVGSDMSDDFKEAYRKRNFELIEVDWESRIDHIDEAFAVIPDISNKDCGIALFYADPLGVANKQTDPKDLELAKQLNKNLQAAIDRAKKVLHCENLKAFPWPVYIGKSILHFNPSNLIDSSERFKKDEADREPGFIPNPINSLVFPQKDGSVKLLVPEPFDLRDQNLILKSAKKASDAIGKSVEIFFIRADEAFLNLGGIHCMSQDIRSCSVEGL